MFKRKIFLILLTWVFAQTSWSQFDSQTPFSYYGLGNLVGNQIPNQFAMGGVSHAIRDSVYVNFYNPASYSSIDVTQLNFGFEVNNIFRTENGINYTNQNAFINHFGLGIPLIHKHKFLNWGMYVGYAPYSQVGYNLFDSSDVVINSDTLLARYRYNGSGGFNRITVGSGFQLGKNFSIGGNFQYMFGSADRSRSLGLPPDSGYLSSQVRERTSINYFSFDVGAQGYFKIPFKTFIDPKRYRIETKDESGKVISKRDSIIPDSVRRFRTKRINVVLGGTYKYGGTFNAGFEQLGIQYFESNIDFGVDTFLLNPNSQGEITMPHSFGGGISFSNPGIWTLAADFNYTLWEDFKYFDQPDVVYNNSLGIHLGAEYSPYFEDKYNTRKNRFFKNLVYRGGLRYFNRFYSPDNNPVDEFGISFGLGLPFGFEKNYDTEGNQKIIISYINFGVEGGFANSRSGGLVNESFIRFNFSITLRDKWFTKRYYN